MDDTESLEKTDFSLLRLIFTKDNMEYGNKIANYFYNRIKDKGYRDDQLVRKIKEKDILKVIVQRCVNGQVIYYNYNYKLNITGTITMTGTNNYNCKYERLAGVKIYNDRRLC